MLEVVRQSISKYFKNAFRVADRPNRHHDFLSIYCDKITVKSFLFFTNVYMCELPYECIAM